MTDKVIINDINVVSGCPNKSDDDCMAMPILNEYGDLLYYQSCQAQVACSYRLKQQLQCKEQELKQLKQKYYTSTTEVKEDLIQQNNSLKQECEELKAFKEKVIKSVILPICDEPEIINLTDRYKQALEKIEEILQQDYVELSDISKVINEVKE